LKRWNILLQLKYFRGTGTSKLGTIRKKASAPGNNEAVEWLEGHVLRFIVIYSESIAVLNQADIVLKFSREERRLFLQFVSGLDRQPVCGFNNFSPPLTVTLKTLGSNEKLAEFRPSAIYAITTTELPDFKSRKFLPKQLMAPLKALWEFPCLIQLF